MKKTLVLGASPNPARYSFLAVRRLLDADIEVVAVGIRKGEIDGLSILQGQPPVEDLHTISLYVGPKKQEDYYDYILKLRPKRLIFNPGTENPVLAKIARNAGIETQAACTLVMLSVGNY